MAAVVTTALLVGFGGQHSGAPNGVEDVLEEHLRTIVSHVVVQMSALGPGDG